MKKLIYICALIIIPMAMYSQQFPFLEGYNMNPFSMSPAYAGLKNPQTIFIDYRSDWSGVAGGPVTYQLSYNDRIFEKVGIGGKLVYDKTDIFKQVMFLATYTYEVEVFKKHFLNFGLSAGLFRNSIDLAKYYSDPDFVVDDVLIYGLQKSKIKFASDISTLYRFRQIEAGILFSNVMFGSAKYNGSDIGYKPMKNYLVHAAYNFEINKDWSTKPYLLLRGGQNYPAQIEFAAEVLFREKFWGTGLFRTGGVYGMGVGAEVYSGVILNYSYNMSSNVAMNAFSSHQITLGINIKDLSSPGRRR